MKIGSFDTFLHETKESETEKNVALLHEARY